MCAPIYGAVVECAGPQTPIPSTAAAASTDGGRPPRSPDSSTHTLYTHNANPSVATAPVVMPTPTSLLPSGAELSTHSRGTPKEKRANARRRRSRWCTPPYRSGVEGVQLPDNPAASVNNR